MKMIGMMALGMAFAVSAGDPPKVVAHRGGSLEQDENTLAAFQASYAKGVRRFETDIQLTRDQRVVILHDGTLDRTTDGTGNIQEKTAADLASVRTKKTGQPLPFLEEVLDFLKSKPGTVIQVEIKVGKSDPDAYVQALCEAANKLVSDRALSGQVIFISFNAQALEKIKALSPAQKTCLVSSSADQAVIKGAKAIGAESVSVQLGNLSRNFVRNARKAGLEVTTWTVAEDDDARLAALLGVDYMASDIPARLLEQKLAQP